MRDASFWSVAVTRAITVYAILVFVVLWVGLVVAILVNRGWLDLVWNWAQALPVVPRIIVWILILPIMVVLWIWRSGWPAVWHIVGFAAIGGWTLLAVSSLYKTFR